MAVARWKTRNPTDELHRRIEDNRKEWLEEYDRRIATWAENARVLKVAALRLRGVRALAVRPYDVDINTWTQKFKTTLTLDSYLSRSLQFQYENRELLDKPPTLSWRDYANDE